MATVNVMIHGTNYKLSCDNGQEKMLENLASVVDENVQKLAKSLGTSGGENLLLVMTAIMMTDKLMDAENEIKRLKQQISEVLQNNEQEKGDSIEEALAPIMHGVTQRLEKLLKCVEN